MEAIKSVFLETAEHYDALGKHNDQYVALLTYASLDSGDTFSITELRRATRKLPSSGLHTIAQNLVRALEGAGDQYDDYWVNRIAPYLRKIWPKNPRVHIPSNCGDFRPPMYRGKNIISRGIFHAQGLATACGGFKLFNPSVTGV